MKLQIAYDFTNLKEALASAKDTESFADIIEVGTLLLYAEGIKAVEAFKQAFPNKVILADAKICDRAQDAVSLLTKAGASMITVLAGTSNETIREASNAAHRNNAKIALDLVDAYSMGQSARDADQLGVDYVLFHRAHEAGAAESIIDQWDDTRGNTNLPIFVSGNVNRTNINRILPLKPNGIIIGAAITKAKNPAAEAEYFKNRMESV